MRFLPVCKNPATARVSSRFTRLAIILVWALYPFTRLAFLQTGKTNPSICAACKPFYPFTQIRNILVWVNFPLFYPFYPALLRERVNG